MSELDMAIKALKVDKPVDKSNRSVDENLSNIPVIVGAEPIIEADRGDEE